MKTPTGHRLAAVCLRAAAVLCGSTVLCWAEAEKHSGTAVSSVPPETRSIQLRPVNPVAYFRELLVMPPDELNAALAAKPAEQRSKLIRKIREYQAMSPEERNLRLKMTELRWHLVPLMKLPPIERLKPLAALPPEDRALIDRRLKVWDEIPVHLQKEFLENEAVIGHVLRLTSTSLEQPSKAGPSPEEKAEIESKLSRWRTLPPEKQRELCGRFNEFFELNPAERSKTLATLSDAEREQMERTLRQFENLPPGQRRQCIESFRKFAGMSAGEREQFLKNAGRWESMSPSERQAWSDIVRKTPELPPLPPMPMLLAPFPPLPPASGIASTNSMRPSVPPAGSGLP